jgi:transposase
MRRVARVSTHLDPDMRTWLAANPRVTFHFTPTSASWMNQVETWFGILTRKAILPGQLPERQGARHNEAAPPDSTDPALEAKVRDVTGLYLDPPDGAIVLSVAAEVTELYERIAVLLGQVDPAGIIRSAPGVGRATGAAILGRLGDPSRLSSQAAARSSAGRSPRSMRPGRPVVIAGPTKRGDAVLREALFLAADHARRLDPSVTRHHRLMT